METCQIAVALFPMQHQIWTLSVMKSINLQFGFSVRVCLLFFYKAVFTCALGSSRLDLSKDNLKLTMAFLQPIQIAYHFRVLLLLKRSVLTSSVTGTTGMCYERKKTSVGKNGGLPCHVRKSFYGPFPATCAISIDLSSHPHSSKLPRGAAIEGTAAPVGCYH